MNKFAILGVCGTLLATAACHPAYDNRMGYDDSETRWMFDRIDSNHNGYITVGENNLFAKQMFIEADVNHDNVVSYDEFMAHAERYGYDHDYDRNYYGNGVYNNDGEVVHGYNEPYNARNNSFKGDRNQYKGSYGNDWYYNDQYDRWERR